MEADDPENNRKRDAPSASLPGANGTPVVNDGKVGSMVNQFEAHLSKTVTPPSHVHVRDPKRMRAVARTKGDKIALENHAGSGEGRRPSK
jgi:hypothetical protein